VNEGLRQILLELSRAKSLPERLAAVAKVRPAHLAPSVPQNSEPRTGLSMGESAALTALEWEIGRQEQDELAVASHQHLAAAYDRGLLRRPDDAVPRRRRDTNLRPDSSWRSWRRSGRSSAPATAPPMTAANSTPLTDGASTVLLCSEEYARQRGWEPLAFLSASQTAAADYVHGGEGLLMAPTYAMPRCSSEPD
jgi:acetyl-CoA C-acetyltransferase